MTITDAQIASWVGAFAWPFLRIGALMLSAPFLGNLAVNTRTRVLLSVALTVAILPVVGEAPAVDPLSAEAAVMGVHQVLAGVAMGLLVSLAFQAVVIAGEVIALSMGLGFATMISPQTGQAVPVVSQFLLVVTTLLFLAMGGHLMLIQLLAESFTLLPLDAGGMGVEALYTLARWGGEMYAGAVLIALPAVALLLTTNMIIGVMTRAAPQMNIFSVGFPLTILMGMVVILMLVLPSLPTRMANLWADAFDTVRQVLGG